MISRLKWVHLAPPVLLAVCLTSMYMLATQLADELRTAHAHELASMPMADGGSVTTPPPPLLFLPSSFDEARSLSLSLSQHLRSHPQSRLLLICLFASVYVLKQAFSIPGSALLNVMAGFIFGVPSGVPLVAFLTATGASGCYWMSALVGGELLLLFPSLAARVARLHALIDAEKRAGTLFLYLLVLRVFPFTPNFFVNLASPLVGIPFAHFFATCMIGLVPYVYITVSAGDTLRAITSMQQEGKLRGEHGQMQLADIMDAATMVKMALLALALLIPIILKKYLLNKNDKGEEKGKHFKL